MSEKLPRDMEENELRYHCAAITDENDRLRATLLNIQATAERGLPIDYRKLADQCRHALNSEE